MKALVIHKAGDLRLEERQQPAPAAGQVLIDIRRGGICGSDLHYFNHGGFGSVRLREPMILGHEVSGAISALGKGVADLCEGDLVAVSPSRPDWNDAFSREGMPHQSRGMRFYGSAMPMPHIQGAFRQQLVVEAEQCVKASGLGAEEAAMAEPLAVVLHGLSRAGDILGRRVLVTGCGPIGCLAILALRRAGAAEIVATDISETALAFAARCGADQTINTGTGSSAFDAFQMDKGWFHLALECSGAAPALLNALPALRPQGVLVQLGNGGEVPLPMSFIVAREIEIRGSFRFHFEFAHAVTMMQKRLIDVRPLITHTFDLADYAKAFEMANDKAHAMKVQLAF